MKATRRGPVIGIALEGWAGGRGQVLMLVGRDWYGGEISSPENAAIAGSLEDGSPTAIDASSTELSELRERLAALEALVGRQAPERRAALR